MKAQIILAELILTWLQFYGKCKFRNGGSKLHDKQIVANVIPSKDG